MGLIRALEGINIAIDALSEGTHRETVEVLQEERRRLEVFLAQSVQRDVFEPEETQLSLDDAFEVAHV